MGSYQVQLFGKYIPHGALDEIAVASGGYAYSTGVGRLRH